MRYLLTIMTCDRINRGSLETTLASLRESDWGEEPLVISDTTKHYDPKISQTNTAFQILQEAMKHEWDYLVFCEDDVLFNKHLRNNLDNWTPVKYGMCLVGSLYQGDVPAKVYGGDYGLYDATLIGGSQAVVVKRCWLPVLLDMWVGLKVGMQDMRFFFGVNEFFPFVYVSHPNLVQHQPVPSTWAGPKHQSVTFDPDWKHQ